MSLTNAYITLAELKSHMGIVSTSTSNDAAMETVITSVSRWIDNYCHRRFWASSEARYYTPDENYRLYVDDLLAVNTLGTDSDGDRTYETTWAVTDYDLYPDNALLDDKPYWAVDVSPASNYSFPAGVKKAVKLEGVYGYCTYSTQAPSEVKEACLIQCSRIWKRKDSPFGIAGKSDLGTLELIPKLDSDVKAFLDPFRRYR